MADSFKFQNGYVPPVKAPGTVSIQRANGEYSQHPVEPGFFDKVKEGTMTMGEQRDLVNARAEAKKKDGSGAAE